MGPKIQRAFLAVLVILLAAACAASAPAAPSVTAIPTEPAAGTPAAERTPLLGEGAPAPTPVIVDTDMGADDMMALLYILQRPDAALEAVTVSGTGLTHCGPGTRNVLALLARSGAAQVPVACGREQPLQGDNHFPPSWRAAADAMYGLRLQDAGQLAPGAASEVLVSAIRAASRPVIVVALGPLTNVAEALQGHPRTSCSTRARRSRWCRSMRPTRCRSTGTSTGH